MLHVSKLAISTAITLLLVYACPSFGASFGIPLPEPQSGTICLCHAKDCFLACVATATEKNGTLITIVTESYIKDAYLYLYLGWILHLFGDSDTAAKGERPHILVIEPSVFLGPDDSALENHIPSNGTNRRIVYASIFLMQALQDFEGTWVHTLFQHGPSSFSINSVLKAHKKNSHLNLKLPRALLHLNHEQPWELRDKTSQDFTFETTEELSAAYSLFPLVLRNYFYEPLIANTGSTSEILLLPLGPCFYGFIVGNQRDPAPAHMNAASERSGLCYFAGRGMYSGRKSADGVQAQDEGGGESAARQQAATEIDQANGNDRNRDNLQRAEFLKLLSQSRRQTHAETDYNANANADKIASGGGGRGAQGLAACDVRISANARYDEQAYVSYLHALSNTVFALCPPGNNPETFRIYEALERGAIPLLVRSSPDRDFTGSAMWGGGARLRPAIASQPLAAVAPADASILLEDSNAAHCLENKGSCSNQEGEEILAYPGPIFSTWSEVDSYLSDMAVPEARNYSSIADFEAAVVNRTAVLDRLQQDLQRWYASTKTRSVRDIRAALRRAYGRK